MPIEYIEPTQKHPWFTLALLASVNFVVLLDVTIINVALPSIERDLDIDSAAMQWLVSGYILAYAIGLLPSGRAGDRFGHDRLLLIGMAIFALASLVCGLAPTGGLLQAGRVTQGVGAALVSPQSMALAHRMFQGKNRTSAFAIFGLVAGLASVMGPLAGGWIIGHDLWGLGWRVIFLINLPFALMLGITLWRYMPEIGGDSNIHFDIVATVLVALLLLLILVPLIEGPYRGWPFWSWIMMLATLPAIIILRWWERRRAQLEQPQLIPLSLLKTAKYAWYGIAVGLFFAGLPGFFMTLAIFLQMGFGFTPWQSGVTAFPLSLGIMISSILAPAIQRVSAHIRLVFGAVLVLLGLGLLRDIVVAFTGEAQQSALMGFLLISGLGFGLVIGPLFHLALEKVAVAEAGVASALLQVFQQFGGVFGVALTSTVFFAELNELSAAGYRSAFATGLIVPLSSFFTFLTLILILWLFKE